MTTNVWICFAGKNKPQYDTVSPSEGVAQQKAANKKLETWKQLVKKGWSCINVDIEIKLRD